MSKGIGGFARVVMQDDNTVVYEYSAYNLNVENYSNPEHIYDGIITIDKNSFAQPEIHKKLKKLPSGKRKPIEKRIPCEVDYSALISSGKISVENSNYCWETFDNGIGIIAMHIIFKIFNLYQSEGVIPEVVGYHV